MSELVFRFLFSSPLSLSSNQATCTVLAAHLWARGRGLGERWAGSSDTYSAWGRGCRSSDTPAATKDNRKKGGEPTSKWPLSWKNNNRRPKWGPLSPKSLPHSPVSHTDQYNHSITFWKGSLKDHIFFQSQRIRVRGVSLPARRQHYWETSLKSSASFTNSAKRSPLQLLKSVCHKKQLHLKNALVIIY